METGMVGFKEWSVIFDALGSGQHSIILRKGGIAEGRDGFRFQHHRFFLFPTHFHEQAGRLRVQTVDPLATPDPDGRIMIRNGEEVCWTADIATWEVIERLEPFHLWRSEVIRERYEYCAKGGRLGIVLALVRTFTLQEPWLLEPSPRFGGCRSWVELSTAPDTAHAWKPVLDEDQHRRIEHAARSTMNGARVE
jgi:hypothetical protein